MLRRETSGYLGSQDSFYARKRDSDVDSETDSQSDHDQRHRIIHRDSVKNNRILEKQHRYGKPRRRSLASETAETLLDHLHELPPFELNTKADKLFLLMLQAASRIDIAELLQPSYDVVKHVVNRTLWMSAHYLIDSHEAAESMFALLPNLLGERENVRGPPKPHDLCAVDLALHILQKESKSPGGASKVKRALSRPDLLFGVASWAVTDPTEALRALADFGAPIDIVHPSTHDTLLHATARAGHYRASLWLIERKRNSLEHVNAQGETVLHAACAGPNAMLVQYLCDLGGTVNARTADTVVTPLHYAARQGNYVMVAALVKAGANIHACDYKERTPLHYAAKEGHVQLWPLLGNKETSENHSKTASGKTAETYLRRHGSVLDRVRLYCQ